MAAPFIGVGSRQAVAVRGDYEAARERGYGERRYPQQESAKHERAQGNPLSLVLIDPVQLVYDSLKD